MRIGALILGVLVAISTIEAAPAPVPKNEEKLPIEVRRVLNQILRETPLMIESSRESAKTFPTEKGRKAFIADVARLERELYVGPITYLEAVLTAKLYKNLQDDEAIREVLNKYRKRYADAKRKGLIPKD